MGARIVGMSIALLLAISGVANAQTVGNAPGFESGPRVTTGGLLWSGARGVSLSTNTGTDLLNPKAPLSSTLVQNGWAVTIRRRGLQVDRVGVKHNPLIVKPGCSPLEPEPYSWMDALDGGSLYVVIRGSCVGKSPAMAPFLVKVPLRSSGFQVLARAPDGVRSLAAAGNKIAIAYKSQPTSRRVQVEVLSGRRARPLYSVNGPAGGGLSPNGKDGSLALQLDAEGDVLATNTGRLPPPSLIRALGWWASPTKRAAHPIHSLYLDESAEPTPNNNNFRAEAAAALWNGQIAYETTGNNRRQIDLLNLSSNQSHTEVSFPGSARLLGLGLGTERLAWAQQSIGWTIPEATGGCVTRALPLSPVELVEINPLAEPLVIDGAPVPPATGPECPPPP
jgi:hypothetical protein